MSRASLWRFLAVALPTLGALIAPLPTVDLAFQLRAGSDILTQHAIPTVDTWTFTVSNTPWVDQQWAAQVLLQLVFAATSWTGLVLLRAALVAVAFGLLLFIVRRRASGLPAAAAAILVIAAFAVSAEALALRPQLFAIVLFAATLAILADRDGHPRLVWLIPILALAWANLHGTFLFAPALCGLAWLADLYDGAAASRDARPDPSDDTASPDAASADAASAGTRREPATRLEPATAPRSGLLASPHLMLIVGLVSLAATLVNPFGLGAWTYVESLTSNPAIAGRVSEWQPPNPLTPAGAIVWLSVLAVATLAWARVRQAPATARSDAGTKPSTAQRQPLARAWPGRAFRSRSDIPWPALLTLLLFGGFALASGRGQAWWPFVAVFVIAPWLERWLSRVRPAATVVWPTPPPPATPPPLRRLNAAIAVLLVLAGVALLPVWRPTGQVGVPNGTLTYAPQGIAGFLDLLTRPAARSCDDRIWNPQAWGSWLELEAPCARYAVDSRIELYPETIWDDAQVVDEAALGWNNVLAQEGATVVVTDRVNQPALEAALRTSPGWTRIYADCDGSVWILALISSPAPGSPPIPGGSLFPISLPPAPPPTNCP